MSIKLLTEQYLEFLSLKGSCTCSSESTLVKMPHSWKSRVTAEISPLEHCAVPYRDIIGMSSLVHTAEHVKIAGGFTIIVMTLCD